MYSSPYYEIRTNFEFSDPVYYAWSKTYAYAGIIQPPYPDGIWVPEKDIEFESGNAWSASAVTEGGRLLPETVENLRDFNCVVKTAANVKRDVIDVFATVLRTMPLLNEKLMSALSDEFPDVFEFVEIPEIWNEVSKSRLPGGPYYLTNLLTRINSWDTEKTKFYNFTRGDGTEYVEAASRQRFISNSLTPKFPIWRDSITSNVICTDRFRKVAEGAGCQEWRFNEIPTSEI